jgi:cyclophilin family peptidyl-prolyl cis-trans isomerase
VKYVLDGHYNGTVFHRVIDGFMIQGRREKIRGDKVEATRFGGKFREMAKNNGVTMT